MYPGPWLESQTIPYTSLDEFFALSAASENDWEYSVSWIDCLSAQGRGLFMRGNHADVGPRPLPRPHTRTMPLQPPVSLVNALTLRPFNWAYFNLNKGKSDSSIVHYEPFFYPLDNPMVNYKELVEFIVKYLVTQPDAVSVESGEEENGTKVMIRVAHE